MDTSRYGMLSRPQGFPRETDFRSAAFAAWCSRLEGRRVGIYGTGANARHVLAGQFALRHRRNTSAHSMPEMFGIMRAARILSRVCVSLDETGALSRKDLFPSQQKR